MPSAEHPFGKTKLGFPPPVNNPAQASGGSNTGDDWYLDHLAVPWENFYQGPLAMMDSLLGQDVVDANVVGGEAEMWGETVDPSDMDATIWPRASGVAERLWSPRGTGLSGTAGSKTDPVKVTTDAYARIGRWRCLMVERGIRATTVQQAGRRPPTGPGSCWQGLMASGGAEESVEEDTLILV